jgi:pimeloyl-ACP methyl ester carboxylesterase
MGDKLVFLHGLEGSSQGVKATLLRDLYPKILTPDFHGVLEERMSQLDEILGDVGGWIIVGSSFGGLMGALFTCLHAEQVMKLVLLAPALVWPDFAGIQWTPVQVPVVLYHGLLDELIPLELVKEISQRVFLNLDFRQVEDDHGLYKTVHAIDWMALIGEPRKGGVGM